MLTELEGKVFSGKPVTIEEAMQLTSLQGCEVLDLIHAAWRITRQFSPPGIDLCSIINAKSGLCSEDCRFCAQSAHYATAINSYSSLAPAKILEQAQAVELSGADRLALVASGRGPNDRDLDLFLDLFCMLKRETGLNLCASLGIITAQQAKRLVEAGVTTYHHNLESSRSFFPAVCTTHNYEDRVATIRAAQEAGMQVCSGGILGLGESWHQRLELADELRMLGISSIPINILNPIPGTPLEQRSFLPPLEILKAFAIFRFILPGARLRMAGGRFPALHDLQPMIFQAGINALLIGDYLTTSGRSVAQDLTLLTDLGLRLRSA